MQPNVRAESPLSDANEFCRLVLEIIAELSPCPEPTLFVVAATRGLQRFGDGTLDDLSKRLRPCVQELKARGLVEIREQLLIAPARTAGTEDILDLTANLEFRPQFAKEMPAGGGGNDVLDPTREPQHEDILDLIAEFDGESRPFELDKAPINQQQPPTQSPETGGQKHATETTREEVIAALRKFISND
jgi:hypothetical protein